MVVMMVYLTTSLSRCRPASPARGNNKVAKLKSKMAAEYAAELLNWWKGSRATIRALIYLSITEKYFRRNMESAIIAGMVTNAAIVTR